MVVILHRIVSTLKSHLNPNGKPENSPLWNVLIYGPCYGPAFKHHKESIVESIESITIDFFQFVSFLVNIV